jgi:hypothetical protein
MTDHQKAIASINDLLRQACADDLPEDVAAAMSRHIGAFVAEAQVRQRAGSTRTWLFPKFVWAAISILMLLAGVFLQGARVSSPLADRISSLKSALAGLETTRR